MHSLSDFQVQAFLGGIGLASGMINVIAAGGSFFTLPALIFVGLPPLVANATNRIGVVAQAFGGVTGFHRHGVLDWSLAGWTAGSALAGSLVGTRLAFAIDGDSFRRLLAVLMVGFTIFTLTDPLKRLSDRHRQRFGPGARRGLLVLGFFAIGVYSGFVQAGVGFMILAATSLLGLDLVRGNAIKVLTILGTNLVAFSWFLAAGQVDWWYGIPLALGNLIGGLIGVHLAVYKGHDWIKRVVAVAVVVVAIRLWYWA